MKQPFDSIEALQAYTDAQLTRDSQCRECPVTGKSIHDTWLNERELLSPLPETLPEPLGLVRTCRANKDSTIRFHLGTQVIDPVFENCFAWEMRIAFYLELRVKNQFRLSHDRNTAVELRT